MVSQKKWWRPGVSLTNLLVGFIIGLVSLFTYTWYSSQTLTFRSKHYHFQYSYPSYMTHNSQPRGDQKGMQGYLTWDEETPQNPQSNISRILYYHSTQDSLNDLIDAINMSSQDLKIEGLSQIKMGNYNAYSTPYQIKFGEKTRAVVFGDDQKTMHFVLYLLDDDPKKTKDFEKIVASFKFTN